MAQVRNLSQQQELKYRGKYAEEKVRDELKKLSISNPYNDFERNYDARSSMGRIPARAGDFTVYNNGEHGVIEVKQVAHDFRLPRKNFDPEKKFGKLARRRMAGGWVEVFVFHSTTGLWRRVPFEYFGGLRDAKSWDLREFKTHPDVSHLLYLAGII